MTVETREEIDLMIDTISDLGSTLEDYQVEEEEALDGFSTTDPDPDVKLARFNRKKLKAAQYHLDRAKAIMAGIVRQNN